MTCIEISAEAFRIPRTPAELKAYAEKAYGIILGNKEQKEQARLRKGHFKTFVEEFLPFCHFCVWKYGGREDVLCSLAEGTPDGDGIVMNKVTSQKHNVEITWPVDGVNMMAKNTQLNRNGYADLTPWDCEDTSSQKDAVARVLEIARKKALRDYRSPGGSSIVFVFERSRFWDDDPQHMTILSSLAKKLATVPFKSQDVFIMQIFGEQKSIVKV